MDSQTTEWYHQLTATTVRRGFSKEKRGCGVGRNVNRRIQLVLLEHTGNGFEVYGDDRKTSKGCREKSNPTSGRKE